MKRLGARLVQAFALLAVLWTVANVHFGPFSAPTDTSSAPVLGAQAQAGPMSTGIVPQAPTTTYVEVRGDSICLGTTNSKPGAQPGLRGPLWRYLRLGGDDFESVGAYADAQGASVANTGPVRAAWFPISAKHGCIFGQTISQISARVGSDATLMAHAPDVVISVAGINDVTAGTSSGIAAVGSAVVAKIQHGAGAGLEEVKKRVGELEAKVKALESLPREWADAKVFINEQLAAARRSIEGRVGEAVRRQTGSFSQLPSPEELRRLIGYDEVVRRVAELEEQHDEDQKSNVALQLQLARLDERLGAMHGNGGKR